MFRDREGAARRLAARLKGRVFRKPLVLAIPRGGVAVGAVLARELDADLDVVLSRKLRAPGQPELAIGAVSETGHVYLNHHCGDLAGWAGDHLAEECRHQMAEIERRKASFRRIRPAVPVKGRSVIVTDDGIATGSTMIGALVVVRGQAPHELIVAVPVASRDRLAEVSEQCDEIVCLSAPPQFGAVGQFYADFRPVEDEQVVEFLREFAPGPKPTMNEARGA
jgi:predicted phosphoribosyltransferase